jgi:hypothetical protein
MRRFPGRWLALLVVVGGAALALAELADVYLRNGLRLRGDVEMTEEEVIIRTELGELRYPRDMVERVVPATSSQPAPETQPATTQPTELAEPAEPTEETGRAAPPMLSALDIQRLKLSELRVDGDPEKVRVRFAGRNQRELPAEVLTELTTRPNYRDVWEETLLRGTPQEKLQLIAATTGLKYVDRITINNDPEVFAAFRSGVLPTVVKSCARRGCHSGDDAVDFRFPKGPTTSEAYAYTTFALLERMETKQGVMINRDNPEGGVLDGSVLLSYLLPQRDNPQAHPPVPGTRQFKPGLRGRDNVLYERIRDWINLLRTPHPKYELEYEFPADLPGLTLHEGEEEAPAPATEPRPAGPFDKPPAPQP